MTGPGWTDLLRYPEGALLRAELTLQPFLRDALRARLGEGIWPFALPEVATLRLERLDAGSLHLTCLEGGLLLALQAARGAAGEHVLAYSASLGERRRHGRLERVVLQTAGPREAYVAVAGEQGRRPFLHLRYARSGDAATLSLVTAAFRDQVPEKQRPWLPGEVEFARLQRLPAAAP